MLTWKKKTNDVTNVSYYYAETDKAVFQIVKKKNKWIVSVGLDGVLWRSWQITKTLKAAKAACEVYSRYNLL